MKHATVTVPLSDLTRKSLLDKVKWKHECETAFVVLKEALCRAPVLSNPYFSRQFVLQTEGGCCVETSGRRGGRPSVVYFSRITPQYTLPS